MPAVRVSAPLPPTSVWNEPVRATELVPPKDCVWPAFWLRSIWTGVVARAKLRVLFRVPAAATSLAPGINWNRLLPPVPPTSVSSCVPINVSLPLPPTNELNPESPTRIDAPAPPIRVSCPVPTAAMVIGAVMALASSREPPCVKATICVVPDDAGRVVEVLGANTRNCATVVMLSPSSSVTFSVTWKECVAEPEKVTPWPLR